jgi:hypothetical protein
MLWCRYRASPALVTGLLVCARPVLGAVAQQAGSFSGPACSAGSDLQVSIRLPREIGKRVITMRHRSPIFREQCRRLAEAPWLHPLDRCYENSVVAAAERRRAQRAREPGPPTRVFGALGWDGAAQAVGDRAGVWAEPHVGSSNGGFEFGSVRARSTIKRAQPQLTLAVVDLAPFSDPAMWLPYEFEHLIEQIDGVNLVKLVAESLQAWRVGEHMFETRRAIRAGEAVFDEVQTTRCHDKFVDWRPSP